jgi:hypothetical protein
MLHMRLKTQERTRSNHSIFSALVNDTVDQVIGKFWMMNGKGCGRKGILM